MTTPAPAGLRHLSLVRLLALFNAELEQPCQVREREEQLVALLREFMRRGIATRGIIPELRRFDPGRRVCLDACGTRLALGGAVGGGKVLPFGSRAGESDALALFLMHLEAQVREEEEGRESAAGEVRYAPEAVRQGILELLRRQGRETNGRLKKPYL